MSDRPRIVVTRRIPEPALELLREAGELWLSPYDRALTTEELHASVAGARAVVSLLHDKVDESFLDSAGPRLAVVANVAVGYDNIDVAACAGRGVVVTNTPGVLTEATADIAFALILAVTRRLGEGERLVRARTPWSWNMFFLLGSGIPLFAPHSSWPDALHFVSATPFKSGVVQLTYSKPENPAVNGGNLKR